MFPEEIIFTIFRQVYFERVRACEEPQDRTTESSCRQCEMQMNAIHIQIFLDI